MTSLDVNVHPLLNRPLCGNPIVSPRETRFRIHCGRCMYVNEILGSNENIVCERVDIDSRMLEFSFEMSGKRKMGENERDPIAGKGL